MFNMKISLIFISISWINSISSDIDDLWNPCNQVDFTNSSACAALYRGKDCQDERPNGLPNTKGKKFNLPAKYDLKPKSLSVNRGCALQVFTQPDCKGYKFLFIAQSDRRKFVYKDLDDSITKTFCKVYNILQILFSKFSFFSDKNIACIKCYCKW